MNTKNSSKHEEKNNKTLEDGFDTSDNRKVSPSAVDSVTDSDASNKQQDKLAIDNIVGKGTESNLKLPKNSTDPFSNDHQTHFKKNKRATTRFIREDITAFINFSGLLGFSKTISVKLKDIASKGVLISTDQKLGINKKITLILRFRSGKVFVIKAIVVRHSRSSRNEYGIKFDRYNNELGDYLLETQKELIFK